MWRTHVVLDQLPKDLVGTTGIFDLEGVEVQALGIGIACIDDAARAGRERTEVDMMCGGARKSDQFARVKDRHDEAHVGLV